MDIENIKKFFSGKYEFIRLLGTGGFAEVHLAIDKMLEREVAIKILHPQHASDPDIVKRFIREARLYAKLEHPNLINIYETGIAEGTAFIVMKYVKGENLKSYIQKDIKTRLSLVSGIIESLSGALNYIHKKGIIHRDIKPANIIIEDGGKNIFLADFGIARSDSSQTMTMTGSIMGTPYYISPEQIKGGVIDQRSDIYAFGATLYELVTGKPVFSADSSVEILYKHVNSEPEQIGKTTPETPKTLKYIISKCLEKKPEKRFQSAIEISEILSGKRNASMTKYLNSIEPGRKKWKKKLIFTLSSLILVPVLVFLVYKGISGSGTENSDSLQKKEINSGDVMNTAKVEKKEPVIPAIKKDVEETSNKDQVKTGTPDISGEKTSAINLKKRETSSSPDKAPMKKTVKDPILSSREKAIEPVSNEPGKIRFSSYPPASVLWNGLKLGDTIQIFKKEFPPGKYKFTFTIPGYLTEEKEIVVEPGKEISAHFKFKAYGFLTITARPFARFFINGVDHGENPLFEKKIPIGTHKIKAIKSGYITEEQVIKIENMKKINISFSLKKEKKK